MENLTSGNISEKKVKLFQKCLKKADGNLPKAAKMADELYGLNWAVCPNNEDSWHESLERYRAKGGLIFV